MRITILSILTGLLLSLYLVDYNKEYKLEQQDILVHHPSKARNLKVFNIYNQLQSTTGQSQDRLPLYIVQSSEENAYVSEDYVVIYTGLLDNALNWDEVALVLGHEIAHYNLGHLNKQLPVNKHNKMGLNDYIAVLEANADKLGAFYALKAGFNVCLGREIFKRWREARGNAIGQEHPDYSYRYEELNLQCNTFPSGYIQRKSF